MQHHPVVEKIKNLIASNNLWSDYLEHEPVKTSQEAAQIRPDKYTLDMGAKALIVRVKNTKKFFVMLVVPGDKKFDENKVKEYFSAKDIRFATKEEIAEITQGVEIGGIPPFGNLFNLPTYVDSEVLKKDLMIFNAGERTVSIALKTLDYKNLIKPSVIDIT